ncbi:MAG: UbiA prenyltransferase family protein [Erysipelotrichaceae bacterium]|nr:UbiA prenyltransferase family protein [Erysipelotrichaceae bacterium]
MKYIKLMRIKHYIKNILFVFIPLIFSMNFMNVDLVFTSIYAFVAFSFSASIVYIVNDIFDAEKDRQHPKKKHRPIASGQVGIPQAIALVCLLVIVIVAMVLTCLNVKTGIIILIYVIMNLAYSFKLKHVVLVDVLIIAIGFILRIYAGAYAIEVAVSEWLLLTAFAVSLFLGFGKRYGEKAKIQDGNTRKVLSQYDSESLKIFIVISMTLTIVFYSLYTILGNSNLTNSIFTIPLVVIGMFRYYMLLEGNINDGDPTEVILNDRIIQIIVVAYATLVLLLMGV